MPRGWEAMLQQGLSQACFGILYRADQGPFWKSLETFRSGHILPAVLFMWGYVSPL